MTPDGALRSMRDDALRIFTRTLEACSVPRAFEARVRLAADGRRLHLEGEDAMDLRDARRVLVIAAGKAAGPMLACLLQTLRPLRDLEVQGVLVAPTVPDPLPDGIQFFAGGHPVPNAASLAGAGAALDLLRRNAAAPDAAAGTVCVFLLSGGASALLELPFDPAIGLDDVVSFHRAMIGCGAPIAEINCVRKHFSAIKGGRLALAAGPMRCLTIAVSDVPAGQSDALGSGPTLPDSTTVERCRAVLARYRLPAQFPATVQAFFGSAALAETPKIPNPAHRFYTLLSDGHLSVAASRFAEELGYHAVVDLRCDDWNYRDAALHLVEEVRRLRPRHPRLCVVSSGEVTVRLDPPAGAAGIGGRNQQWALYASTLLEPPDDPLVLLSAGSDGVDGNSPAAGAAIDSRMFAGDGARHGVQQALARFDAFPLLQSAGGAIVTGPTGNNLRDLRLLLTDDRVR